MSSGPFAGPDGGGFPAIGGIGAPRGSPHKQRIRILTHPCAPGRASSMPGARRIAGPGRLRPEPAGSTHPKRISGPTAGRRRAPSPRRACLGSPGPGARRGGRSHTRTAHPLPLSTPRPLAGAVIARRGWGWAGTIPRSGATAPTTRRTGGGRRPVMHLHTPAYARILPYALAYSRILMAASLPAGRARRWCD